MSKLVFENCDSATGWTASANADINGMCSVPDYIAGDLSASLILRFNGINSYCEKTYSSPISTSGYTDITIWLWSRNLKKRDNIFRTADDFSYKIDFGAGKEYFLPCHSEFFSVTISTDDISSIDRIRITALTGNTDYLIISYGVLSVDELPLDIFTGLQEKMQSDIDKNYKLKYSIGTITDLLAGDTSITFSTVPDWIDRYATVMITDGTNTEYHSIFDRANNTFKFNGLHDGSSLLHDYVTASVYIYIPVTYGRRQIEIELPSISIWGIEPEKVHLGHQLDRVIDSYGTAGTFAERREGHFQKYAVIIDCDAREDELLATCSKIARDTIGRLYVWVNGQKCDIEFNGTARETEPTDAFQIIPKVQYIADVVIKEELWKRTKLYKTTTFNTTFTIQ